jgi:uncharacterized protein (DUF1800 family)
MWHEHFATAQSKVEDGAFRDASSQHDDGEKTFLGRTGRWAAPDVLSILLDRPAIARRIARRICGLFMGEGVVDEIARTAPADELRDHQLNVGHAVESVLRSKAFYARENLRSRVIGPVEFVIGACRALVLAASMPRSLLLADWSTRLGQELFEPPIEPLARLKS